MFCRRCSSEGIIEICVSCAAKAEDSERWAQEKVCAAVARAEAAEKRVAELLPESMGPYAANEPPRQSYIALYERAEAAEEALHRYVEGTSDAGRLAALRRDKKRITELEAQLAQVSRSSTARILELQALVDVATEFKFGSCVRVVKFGAGHWAVETRRSHNDPLWKVQRSFSFNALDEAIVLARELAEKEKK